MRSNTPHDCISRARALRSRIAALAVLVGLLGVLAPGAGAGLGATAAVTVTMTVPSATSLTNECTQDAAWNLGIVLPNSPATTSTSAGNVCRIGFGSSNDSSMLQVQQHDRTGTAMGKQNADFRELNPEQWVDVDAFDATHLAGATFRGCNCIRWSSDAGVSWTSSATPPTFVTGVAQTGTASAVVTSSNSNIYRTSDGGATWTVAASNPNAGLGPLDDIDNPTAGTLFAVGDDRTMLRSGDSGVNWVALDTATSLGINRPRLTDVSASSATDVWAVGTSGWALHSTDGGSTFTATQPGTTFTSIAAVSTTVAWATGPNSVWRTTNGGTSWTQFAAPTGAADFNSSGVVAIDANTATVVGAYEPSVAASRIITTSNGGTTWTPIGADGFTGSLTAIARIPGGGAVAVGFTLGVLTSASMSGPFTLRSQSGGTTWRSTSAFTPQQVVSVGDRGFLRTSSNGGVNWTFRTSGTTEHLLGVAAARDSIRAWVVGTNGTIRMSNDSGVTWSAQAAPGPTRLTAVAALDVDRVVAVGDGGTIIATSNGGASWSTRTSGTGVDLRDLDIAPDGTLWAAGSSGVILRSSDAGQTWSVRSPPNGVRAISKVSAVSDQIAWATVLTSDNDACGNVWRTLDGGTTWRATSLTGPVAALDSLHAEAACGDAMLATFSGGPVDSAMAAEGGWIGVDMYAMDGLGFIMVGDRGAMWGVYAATGQVSDYSGGTSWGSAATTSMFGGCMQAVGGSTIADGWSVDPGGACTAVDTDPWYAIPSVTATKLAHTASAGDTGQVDLVWGFRPKAAQSPGKYAATIDFVVLAPNA